MKMVPYVGLVIQCKIVFSSDTQALYIEVRINVQNMGNALINNKMQNKMYSLQN